MSYTPPSQPGSESGASLYILPLEEAATPQILFTPPRPSDRYIQVEWSPDGEYLYFVHYDHANQPADQPYPDYQISRMAYPGGQPEKILEHGFWPRISADSSKLVYVALDPVTGANQLLVANADGSNSQEVLFSGFPQIIDAPIFSPDGASILFSAPSPMQAYQRNGLDRLMGVQIVKAHNVPSDWWSVPISGGTATRLTQIQSIKLFGSISPDEKYLASASGEGILVMGLDGSNVRQLLFDPGMSSVVRWIP
jgi:Tol biopolymer transport system component